MQFIRQSDLFMCFSHFIGHIWTNAIYMEVRLLRQKVRYLNLPTVGQRGAEKTEEKERKLMSDGYLSPLIPF